MSEGFKKFKRRLCVKALIKSFICSASAGMLVVGALMVLLKLEVLSVQLPYCILFGAAAALVCFAVCFLLTRPTDSGTARRLDRELKLSEKTQTMLEFASQSGDMIELQRQDANAALCAIPTKRIGFADILRYIPAFVLAAAVLFTGIMYPAKADEPVYEEPVTPFEISEWQIMSLQALIEEVRSSELEEPAKENSVKALEELLAKLYTIETEPEMKAAVIGSISYISREVGKVTSFYSIRASFKKDETAALLCDLLGSLYTPAPPSGAQMVASALTVKESTEESVTYLSPSEMVSKVNTFTDKAHSRLNVSVREGEDGLGDAIFALLDALLASCESITSDMDPEKAAIVISESLSASRYAVEDALYVQSGNEAVGERIRNELMRIFGIMRSELPADVLNKYDMNGNPIEDEEYEEDDYDQELGDGGAGSGEIIYGSNDVIYDPDLNQYVQYGEVMNTYAAQIEKLHDAGVISDEIYDFMTYYFAALAGSLEDKQ